MRVAILKLLERVLIASNRPLGCSREVQTNQSELAIYCITKNFQNGGLSSGSFARHMKLHEAFFALTDCKN